MLKRLSIANVSKDRLCWYGGTSLKSRPKVAAFSMSIDFHIVDGPRGGLTIDLIPCDHAFSGQYGHNRHDPEVFNIRETAFLFIEGMIAQSFPDWTSGSRHWGMTWVDRLTWLDILARFDRLRFDILGNMRRAELIDTYVICPALMPRSSKFHRKALLTFLDSFERRVRSVIRTRPYLLIGGI